MKFKKKGQNTQKVKVYLLILHMNKIANPNKQIIMISGGEVFRNRQEFLTAIKSRTYKPQSRKKWKHRLQKQVKPFAEMLIPEMPNKISADYDARKIRFEKVLVHLDTNKKTILIGYSLGTIFLAKYLTENIFPKTIQQIHLVSPLFHEKGLPNPYIGNFAYKTKNLHQLEKQCKEIFIYHSKDDQIIPVEHAKLYQQHLPHAKTILFTNRGHFFQEDFPELLKNIGTA